MSTLLILILITTGIGLLIVIFPVLFRQELAVHAASTVEVTIPEGAVDSGTHFDPQTITVAKGTTVEWNNKDSAPHTVTSGIPEGGNSGTLFDSSYLTSGKIFKHTFNKFGTFKYYCTLHPSMVGKVVVSKEVKPSLSTVYKQPPFPDFLQYLNPVTGLQLEYPSDWKKIEDKIAVKFASPFENASDFYQEYLYICTSILFLSKILI